MATMVYNCFQKNKAECTHLKKCYTQIDFVFKMTVKNYMFLIEIWTFFLFIYIRSLCLCSSLNLFGRWHLGQEEHSAGNIYPVMQSDQNTFYGDVVLDSFNKASRDGDNILEQIYKKQIFSDFYYEDTQFYEFLVLECCITLDMHFLQSLKCKVFKIKIRKYLLFVYLV